MELRNIVTGRQYEKDGQKKTQWFTIGTAFIHENGDKISLELSALPVNGKAMLFKREAKGDQQQAAERHHEAPRQNPPPYDESDSLPF